MLLVDSADRVPQNTTQQSNEMIALETIKQITYYRLNREQIPDRLRQLDREWDVERALETGSATLSLIGLTLAITHSRKWLIVPLAVQAFFLEHALQGWCPPLPVLRRLGFRTVEEIEEERHELMKLRSVT